MKDPYSVLRAKERDLERVRREIQLLRAVIPLLADEQPASDVMQEAPAASSRTPLNPSGRDNAEQERYHTFVGQSGMSESTKA